MRTTLDILEKKREKLKKEIKELQKEMRKATNAIALINWRNAKRKSNDIIEEWKIDS